MQVVVVGYFGCDLHGKMHFSVPDTVELKDKNGSNYLVSIHVVCSLQFRDLLCYAKVGPEKPICFRSKFEYPKFHAKVIKMIF